LSTMQASSTSSPARPDSAQTRGGIDLHSHTTASDGSFSPTELVDEAAAIGLTAIAVTDHDTIGGIEEATKAAVNAGIELVPGVELSVEDDGGRFHLLGYLFDPDNDKFASTLTSIRASRAKRNEQMAVKMAELGLPVNMDDVRAQAGDKGEVIARPHFAKALLKAGVVNSVQDAFDRFLATGKPLYLPKEVLTPKDAVALIHQAGGVAVMAHPGLVPLSDSAFVERLAWLVDNTGMDGIEAYYSQHTPAQTDRFLELARKHSLVVTGGSDFHGTAKPHVPLGIVYQKRSAQGGLLDGLKAKQRSRG